MTETTTSAAGAAAPLCDRCDSSNPELATHAYVWAWGEKGTCCALHATLLQQTAETLQRSVAIHPLPTTAPVILTRDERVRLQAESLILREELEEAKGRGLELYRVNTQLQQQVQTHTVRERELRAQIKDAEAEVLQLRGRLEERDAEHAELVHEVERLRTLEVMINEPPGHVVG